MPEEMSLRSWRWYEATVETLAVGVYLYANFVLTSTQLTSENTRLAFVTIMALGSGVVRVLETSFWSPRWREFGSGEQLSNDVLTFVSLTSQTECHV